MRSQSDTRQEIETIRFSENLKVIEIRFTLIVYIIANYKTKGKSGFS